MERTPTNGEAEKVVALRRPQAIANFPFAPLRRALRRASIAERVAIDMIARHGPDAAREATIRLNRMIDRGNMPARDLWACVVHVIHERKAS